MPAVSKNQRIAMAIAEHQPGKLYGRNRGLLKMSKAQLHDFAATPEKGLPRSKSKSKSNASMPGPLSRRPRLIHAPSSLMGRRNAARAKAYR